MIKLEATSRTLFEGHVDAGITFWWSEGSSIVLYRTWEHRASGRVYGDVEQSWTGSDLVGFFHEQQWNDEYQIENVTEIQEVNKA